MAKRKRSLHVLPEPKWSEYKDLTDPEDRKKAFNNCLYWVHYEIQEKSGVAPFKKWMKANWDKAVVSDILKLPDSNFYNVAKYAYCWNKLGWMPDDVISWLNGSRETLLEKASKTVEVKSTAPKVVPIRQNLNQFALGIDDHIEYIIRGSKITNYKDFVESYNLNRAEIEQAVAIVDDFAMEFRELAQGDDEQLKEGYSHVKRSTLKHLLEFFDGVVTGLVETKQANKITRIRRKRPIDKNKLVRRLKYTKQHEEYKSIDPVEIIGASEVWVYDVKRKRIGVYASEYEGTLSVKGTVIDNYSLAKSYEKTIRKEETLSAFMGCRKNGLHKFMDGIRGKKFPAKSRVQATMVLLKVVK
jgi:hypothetical protein